jgi:hypothetical protein
MHRRALVFGLCLSALTACQDRTRTRKVLEPFVVVPGAAQVDTGAPKVLTDSVRETDKFAINTPHQCDVFQQLSVRKVDILWVIDSSGSMAPKQARLAASFNGFINQLVTANPPIDFHIAVVTTDTDDPNTRGNLRTWNLPAESRSGSYIGCVPQMPSGTLCNTSGTVAGSTSSAVAAFNQMALVGINGSAQERGLLAAYLALTNPFNQSTPALEKFIRADAALYVIAVSDEDDSSCNPLVSQPVCTADPGCRCASDSTLGGANGYGSTAYFTRFLETYKGYGNQDLVALAAIVATDSDPDAGVPSQFGDAVQHIGCCRTPSGAPCPKTGINAALPDSGMEVGYYGARYLKVAADTGGVAVSICENDSSAGGTSDAGFSGALASLGYAASGLRKEFRLARGPDLRPMQGRASGVELYVSAPTAATCQVDGNCPTAAPFCRENRCAKKLDVALGQSANQPSYVKCDGTSLRNVIRFDGTSVPESLSAVEICYDVQATFQNSCP